MPEARWLLKASPAMIRKLEEDPDAIDDLTDKGHYLTYFPSTISYFTTGNADLCLALAGVVQLDCSTVVNGELGIVKPRSVAAIRAALQQLDLGAIATNVDAAKPKPIAKLGVDDFELLLDRDGPRGPIVVSEIKQLVAFYSRIAKGKAGIAMYTS
jgi:hypothetical protein